MPLSISEVLAQVDAAVAAQTKTASNLSEENQSPSISTDLGRELVKAAALLKDNAAIDISYADLSNFLEKLKNG